MAIAASWGLLFTAQPEAPAFYAGRRLRLGGQRFNHAPGEDVPSFQPQPVLRGFAESQ
jgi:hypothetical protein